jgi:hypothetical protein
MRALSASALVATAMLAIGGQSAHGQEADAIDSSRVVPSDSAATAGLGLPDIAHGQEASASASSRAVPSDPAATAGLGLPDMIWLPPDVNGESTPNAAEAVTPRARAPWEGVYFAHKKDIVDLTTPGPNGYDTEEWRYYLVLRAGGVSEFITQIFYSYYPGFGTQNYMRYFYRVWGPNQTATWTDRAGQFSVTGAGAEGLQDTGNPALNYQRPMPRQTVSFFFRKWLTNYQGLQLTGVIKNFPFPSQEPPTWTFAKISN